MTKTFTGDNNAVKYSTNITGAGVYTRTDVATSESIPGEISSFSVDLFNK